MQRGAIGKERLGSDLNGPGWNAKSDVALSLEHRSIDSYAVVNATTLDTDGSSTQMVQNVATPQRLWEASARLGWQASTRNIFTGTYTANVNNFENVGVGGLTLAEAGYGSRQEEHTIRLSNVQPYSALFLHETRVSARRTSRADTPNSTGTQLQIAGAFTGGGATSQNQRTTEWAVELLDDVVASRSAHTLKVGIEANAFVESLQLPQGFNGSYIFGGGLGPSLDATGNAIPGTSIQINGLEQYRRSLSREAGGTPTAYSLNSGDPLIDFTQFRLALFGEDQWKVRQNIQISFGLRYALQNLPSSSLNLAPRLGFAWGFGTKQRWQAKAHVGVFHSPISINAFVEQQRLDGSHRKQLTIYSPVYGNPLVNGTPIQTIRTYAPDVSETPSLQEQVSIARDFSGWSIEGSLIHSNLWSGLRTLNINAPLNGVPSGSRPSTPNLNLLQYEQNGRLEGNTLLASVSNNKLKYVHFYALYVHSLLHGDMERDPTWSPQSSRTDGGEWAQLNGRARQNIIGTGQVFLPWKASLSGVLRVLGGTPFNVLTGQDNNGDGVFNDRPYYAVAGTAAAIQTRYGLLSSTNGYAPLQRNVGILPWQAYFDTNLSRTFVLNPHALAERRRSLTFNLRAANLLNHTNVTSVGNVLGSSLFGVPYAADSGRRVEYGVRLSF